MKGTGPRDPSIYESRKIKGFVFGVHIETGKRKRFPSLEDMTPDYKPLSKN